MDQKNVAHLPSGIPHCRKKEGTPTLCDSMDWTTEYYVKWISQAAKDKYHMISPVIGT